MHSLKENIITIEINVTKSSNVNKIYVMFLDTFNTQRLIGYCHKRGKIIQ